MRNKSVSDLPAQRGTTVVGKGRLPSLDALRGLSITLVLFSHFLNGVIPDFPDIQDRSVNYGVVGVFIFFCVSGYIIPSTVLPLLSRPLAWKRFAAFWLRRAFRLLPLYVLASVLAWFVLANDARRAAILAAFNDHSVIYALSFFSMTTHFFGLTVPLGGLEWTLAYEIAFYAAVSIFAAIAPRRLGYRAAYVVVAMLGFAMFVPSLPNSVQYSALIYCFFFVGLVTYLHQSERLPTLHFGFMLTAVVSMAFGRVVWWMSIWGVAYWTAATFLSVPVFLFGMYRPIPMVQRVLAPLGVISFSVYLLHLFVIWLIPGNGAPWWFMLAIWVAATVIVGMLSFRFIESPTSRLGHRLSDMLWGEAERAMSTASRSTASPALPPSLSSPPRDP